MHGDNVVLRGFYNPSIYRWVVVAWKSMLLLKAYPNWVVLGQRMNPENVKPVEVLRRSIVISFVTFADNGPGVVVAEIFGHLGWVYSWGPW